MVMTEVAVLLCVKLGAVAIAFTVVVVLTVNAPAYCVDEVVGWLPSNVYKIVEPEVASVMVTVCGDEYVPVTGDITRVESVGCCLVLMTELVEDLITSLCVC